MASGTLEDRLVRLFEERHVAGVRDVLRDTRDQLARCDGELAQALQWHYGDVLAVTEQVRGVYAAMAGVDESFRKLCFDDETFLLDKLPELRPLAPPLTPAGATPPAGVSTPRSTPTLIAVAKWGIAVKQFVELGHTAALQQAIDTVPWHNGTLPEQYTETVTEHNNLLLRHLVEHAPRLDLPAEQLVRLYVLYSPPVNDRPLHYDESLAAKFRDHVVTLLLGQEQQQNEAAPLEEFLHTNEGFRAEAAAQLQRSIYESIEQLEKCDVQVQSALSLQLPEGIEAAEYTASGLVTDGRVRFYKLLLVTLDAVAKLAKYDGGESFAQVKAKLTAVLQRAQQQHHDDSTTLLETSTATATAQLQAVMARYHESNFEELIDDKIRFVTSM